MRITMVSADPEVAAVHELADALTAADHKVTVEMLPGTSVHEAPAEGHRLADAWRRDRPHTVLAHGWIAGLAAQVATRDLPIPVLQRFTGLARPRQDADRARLEAAIGRAAARVLASCVTEIEQLVGIGVRRTRISLVPHGVDTTRFTDVGDAWPRNARHRLLAADGAGDGTTAAALIESLPALPESELLVVGASAAPPGDPRVVQTLVTMAAHRRVAHRVSFLGRVDDLPALLRSADVAVSVPDDDTDIGFVLQAMACGVPVVASAVGALADAVTDGVTGLLVPARAPDRVGDAVRGLLTDDLQRESFGLAATDRARVRFGWEVVVATLERILDEDRSRRPSAAGAPT
jgi:D-inositol-3-phosphate glycosyltransferase